MTPKQEQFCREYLIDLNATQAAIRAGYSKKTANPTASRLLAKANIQARIAELKRDREVRTEINADWVLTRLAKIANFDIRKLFDPDGNLIPVHKLDADTAFALGGIDVTELAGSDDVPPALLKKFKSVDKKGALELLGKHLAMWTERVEQTGNTAQVIITMPDNGRD